MIQQPESSVMTADMCESEKSTIKIFLIDDHKLTRVGLRSALNNYDFVDITGEASSAEEGFGMLRSLKPDIVLMDMGLPKMNGLEATIKIRHDFPDIKIIMLTAHEREEEVIAAMGTGIMAYCLKDISPDALVSVIKIVQGGGCYIDKYIAKYVLKTFPKPKNTDLSESNSRESDKWQLTERELEVLRLLVDGKSNTEIAQTLFVSVHTAKAHVCNILQKLCVDDRVQAAVKAIREEIV